MGSALFGIRRWCGVTELAAPVLKNETPSGIVVEYCADRRPAYTVNDVPVVRVSDVVDMLPKGGLPVWGMKVGMVGILELLRTDQLPDEWMEVTLDDLRDKNHPLMQKMKENELTTWQTRDKAATRGTSVHQGLEDWARMGWLPNPANFPPQEEPYVRGVTAFIEAVQPEPVEVELMVGSVRHGYAGRFDLLARTQEMEVRTGPRTVRKVPAGLGLLDLKTSSGVYDSHFLQLAAYREALEECGYPRPDYEAVIHARDDGTFDFKVNEKTPYQFLSLLYTYKALR